MIIKAIQALKNTATTASILTTCIRSNSFRASLSTIKRPAYSRLYPVKLVKPDGSSIIIKYHEPIAIITLPVNINELDEAERKRRLMKRQMTGKTTSAKKSSGIVIDKEMNFDPRKYLKAKNN